MGLLRFMLALAVASGHAGGFFAVDIYPIVPGSHAVQIFYMISGFLIALICWLISTVCFGVWSVWLGIRLQGAKQMPAPAAATA